MLKIFKEIRANVGEKSPIIDVLIPSTQNPQGQIRTSTKTQPHHQPSKDGGKGNSTAEFCATQGSIHFRQHKVFPRCILWKVYGSDKVLELQSADLIRNTDEPREADVILRFEFPDPIIPHGVALADRKDCDNVNLFVVTASKLLYTIDLRPDYFVSQNRLNNNVADWCKEFQPAPLIFTEPHRLYASDPCVLYISLCSGALLRLTRDSNEAGSHWSLLTLDEKSWGASLRGLINWNTSNTMQYNGRVLDLSTPNSITTTPDQAFAFITTLGHTIKVWDLANRRLILSKDLLGRTPEQQLGRQITLNPADCNSIRIFRAEKATYPVLYYMITYSPHEDGQFKFWGIKSAENSLLELEDLFPDATLKAVDPDPSGNLLWSVADFQVVPSDDGRNMMLWVLWKSDTSHRLYRIHFDLSDLPTAWEKNWVGMASPLPAELPPEFSRSWMVDPTSEWLKFIFTPSRYTLATLSSALTAFLQSTKQQITQKPLDPRALAQAISQAVETFVTLPRCSDTDVDFSRHFNDLDACWRHFWQLAEEIQNRGNEPLALAYDAFADLPYIIFANGCSVVSECTNTEILVHNEASSFRNLRHFERHWSHRNLISELGEASEQLAQVIDLATSFRESLTLQYIYDSRMALKTDFLTEPSLSVTECLSEFYERCRFSDLSDGVYNNLRSKIIGTVGFDQLRTDLILRLMDMTTPGFSGRDSNCFSTKLGLSIVMEGTRETVQFTKHVLFDLLLLTAFIGEEFQDGDMIEFNAPALFAMLVGLLKEYEILDWLGSNTISPQGRKSRHDAHSRLSRSSNDATTSVLQALFAVNIKPMGGVTLMHYLNQQISDVVSWTMRQGKVSIENILVFIQSGLIARDNLDLASEFALFQPDTGWSTYVKGRLYIARREFDTAAICLKKASYSLSHGKPIGDLREMSSQLVDAASTVHFYCGLSKFFTHVVHLFECAQSVSYIADYTRLALQATESENEGDQNSAFRAELTSQLFHSNSKTCHFNQAYSTILDHPDSTFRQPALKILLKSLLTLCGSTVTSLKTILSFPWTLELDIGHLLDEMTDFKQTPTKLATSETTVAVNSPEYLSLLKALYIARNDLHGAAKVSYRKACLLRGSIEDPLSTKNSASRRPKEGGACESSRGAEYLIELLALINLLAPMQDHEAYILVDSRTPKSRTIGAGSEIGIVGSQSKLSMASVPNIPTPPPNSATANIDSGPVQSSKFSASDAKLGPMILTLGDIRQEYQQELDRVVGTRGGHWEFGTRV